MSIHWGGRGAGHVSRWSAATTGVPALTLDFLTTTSLDSRITFTRGSTATFVGSNGLIQSAAINAPRFDYDPVTLAPKGLLIEEQRTNLLLYSEQFGNAYWGKTNATISSDAIASPDGATTADKLVENTATGAHDVRKLAIAASALTAYTASIFVKAGERNRGQIQFYGNSGGSTVRFDLVAKTATATGAYGGWASASATITEFPNGWFRITNTATTNTGLTAANFITAMENASGASSYTGDGTSGFYVWGAQLEASSFATSYIPTVASTVTRNTDVAAMTGTNFSSWYNQSAGTIACNFVLEGLTSSGTADVWSVNDGTSNNAIYLRQGTVITGTDAIMVTGGVVQVDSNSLTTPANSLMKTAFAWSTASSNLTGNGVSLGDGGAITPPTVNQLVLTGSNKWLQRLAFYGSRLNTSQLQTLTQ